MGRASAQSVLPAPVGGGGRLNRGERLAVGVERAPRRLGGGRNATWRWRRANKIVAVVAAADGGGVGAGYGECGDAVVAEHAGARIHA